MLKRVINIFIPALIFVLTGCHDDLPWNGEVDVENEIAIAFRGSSMDEGKAATRAFNANAENVETIHLVAFTPSEDYLYDEAIPKSKFITVNGNQAIKIDRSKLNVGTWYLVANGESQLSSFLSGAKTEEKFRQTMVAKSSVLGTDMEGTGVTNSIMIGKIVVDAMPGPMTSALPTVNLKRLYAKLTFKVAKECSEFLVTGIRLYEEADAVALDGSPIMTLSTARGYSSFQSQIKSSKSGYTCLLPSENVNFFTLPISNEMTVSGKPSEARLLIKGVYRDHIDEDTQQPVFTSGTSETYFCYKFPAEISANHQITLTLKEVDNGGYSSEVDALSHPESVVVRYDDSEDELKNIVTDGEHVIALPDTIYADNGAGTYRFTMLWRGKNSEKLNVSKEPSDASWAQLLAKGESDVTGSSAEIGQGLKRKQGTYEVTLEENTGSDRECAINFEIEGTDLSSQVVLVQKAPENINLNDDLNISLKITRGSNIINIDNYLTFVGNNPNRENGDPELLGVLPAVNGGRIRNAGLHIPMPNGGVTYTYTIYAKSEGWQKTVNLSGVTMNGSGTNSDPWILTFTDTSNPISSYDSKDYVVAEDAIELKSTASNKTLTLDLYHTGFFHEYNSKWYYYEVFKAGNQIWLDRNIGATSAGMAHLTKTYVKGTWPMSSGSQGLRFSYEEVTATTPKMIPNGWRLPSQGDYEALTIQTGFSSDRTTFSGVTFFMPNCRFVANTVKKGGFSTQRSISSFFPHNRYNNGTQTTGDEGAGYYWTSTVTDEVKYKRIMKFVGQNVTADNIEYAGLTLSLRCVAGATNNVAYRYTCEVKGYTHVYLYYKDANGQRTPLTTWPGKEVAIGSMATMRYNTFTYESFVSYPLLEGATDSGPGLYAIFNNPAESSTSSVYSNVNATARENRTGIPFMNGQAYNIYAETDLVYPTGRNYVEDGNWEDKPQFKYIIRGSIWPAWSSGNWINNTNCTVSGGKTYYTDVVVKEGSFGVAQYNESTSIENNSTTTGQVHWWTASEPSHANVTPLNSVNSSTTINLEEGGTNISLSGGIYDFIIDPTDSGNLKLTVRRKVQNFTLYIKNTAGWDPLNIYYWGGKGEMTIWDQKTSVLGTSETIGGTKYYVYKDMPSTIQNFKFHGKSGGNDYETNNYTSLQNWNTGDKVITVEVVGSGENLVITAGKPTVNTTVKVRGDIFSGNWSSNHERALDRVGTTEVYEAEFSLNNKDAGEFVIDVNNGTSTTTYVRNDEQGYITFGSPIKAKVYADGCNFQINKGKYKFSFNLTSKELTITPVGWYLKVTGGFNGWGTNTGGSPLNTNGEATLENVNIGTNDFKILIYNGISDIYYSTGDGGSINTGTWYDVSDSNNLKMSGASSNSKYKVQWKSYPHKFYISAQ